MGFKKLLLDLKIYYRINFIYSKSDKFKRVKSVVPDSIEIGESPVIEKNVLFSSKLKSIGHAVYIGGGTLISNCKSIGHFTSISNDVKIGMASHPQDFISTSPFFYARRRGNVDKDLYNECKDGLVEIGNDVLISANVVILTGIKIGDGAIIGAGAIVNKDVPAYAIVVGVPAKVLKYRFDENTISKLIESKWWDSDLNLLKKMAYNSSNVNLFLEELLKIKSK
ncbi:MAG: CatB-related O-acetyltransferase [Bacteroidota bacterium]